MKRLTRSFMAVAALFAVSCTTDVTEDLGVQLGGDGQTVISLSLEESRTQLGEKAGEVYPLLWSDGDKISVNGVESGEAVINAENAANASFAISGVSTPYAIAYPAAPAGQVLFADKQAYTSNTSFGKGVATMYAYSESGLGLHLNHLTGVLKIGVVGSAKLALAQISTVDRAPIAGAFDLDFTTGELKSTTSSKEVIEYSFGEGVQLSAEPTYIHVAVPAGVYDELYVTLYDVDGGVMYATVKADESKPLSVGKVREFSSNIPYAATDQVFVVKNVATLKEFAEAAPTLEKDVLFVADVDMSGEAWTPIEGYAKTVRGNGYSIKGLTAPLFGTTNASIKGLHLREVALASNDTPIMGGLACVVKATDTVVPVIEHCSVSGTFTVENTTYVPTGSNSDLEMSYAGVVAQSHGARINNCVSNVAFTINQVAVMGNEAKLRPYIGGIVANAYSATLTEGTIYTHLNGCVNNGDILYKDVCCQADNLVIYPSVGGIAAGVHQNTVLANTDNKISNIGVTFTNCTNYGDVTIQANGGGSSADTQGYAFTHAAGVVARAAYNSLLNCDNYGAIKLDGTFLQTFSGGVCGTSWYTNLENCDNYGPVTVTENTIFRGIMLAGISGNNYSASGLTYYSKNCSNNAPITCLGSTDPNAPAGGVYHYRIGGCEGFGRSIATNMVNNKEGVVTCKGNVIYLTKGSLYCNVGGATAYRTTCSQVGTCNYADVNVDINFTIHAGVADDATKVIDRSMYIGGVCGYSTQQLNGSENRGNINVKGSYAGERLYISGCAGYATIGNTHNYGEVNVNATTTNTHTFISGVLSGTDGTGERKNISNEGTINVEGTYTILIVGGLAGQNRLPLTGAVNNGNINVKAAASSSMTAGGLIGYHVRHFYKNATSGIVMEGGNGALTDCTNNGKLTVESLGGAGTVHVGGICRQGQNDMYRCVNNGELEIKGACGNSVYVGGVVTVNSACLREDCVNNGAINVSATSGNASNTGADVFIGGICYSGGSNTTYRRCINNGDITFTGSAANCARFGGLIANIETASKTNIIEECANNGDITMAGTSSARSAGAARYGGLCGQFTIGTLQIIGGYKNTGNITFSGTQNSATGISIGGFIGGSDANPEKGLAVFSNCTGNIINEGTLTYSGTSKGPTYIGGITAFFNNGTFLAYPVKLINTGDIICTGTNDSGTNTFSGLVGNVTAPVDGAQCFCNIYAPLHGEAVPNGRGAALYGILSKSSRTAGKVVFTNAKVGGSITKDRNVEDFLDKTITIDSSNFFEYLYATTPDWSTITPEYDGCTVITSKDQIDYSVNVVETPEAGTTTE